MTIQPSRSERGSALFVAMLMLALMGVIGLAALETVSTDQQVAGFLNRKRIAFYAAEAGLAEALDTFAAGGEPDVVAKDIGDTGIYPYGQPSYALDPTAADPVEDLGIGTTSGMNLAIGGGGPTFLIRYYRIRVQGQAPGGSIARLEVAAGRLQGS